MNKSEFVKEYLNTPVIVELIGGEVLRGVIVPHDKKFKIKIDLIIKGTFCNTLPSNIIINYSHIRRIKHFKADLSDVK